MRERDYQDSELARRMEKWLSEDYFDRIEIRCSRQSSTVFFSYQDINYAAVFCEKLGKRMFCFHVENPQNDLVDEMLKSLTNDSIFNENAVLSKPKFRNRLKEYRHMFKREYVRQDEIYVQNKSVKTAVSAVSIKQLPFGAERRLSGNFLRDTFDYNMRPVMILAQGNRFRRD